MIYDIIKENIFCGSQTQCMLKFSKIFELIGALCKFKLVNKLFFYLGLNFSVKCNSNVL